MRPVMQAGSDDCFRACLASLLEVPLAVVPAPAGAEWDDEYGAWLARYGLALVSMPAPFASRGVGYLIGAYRRPASGNLHAVVLLDGRIIHDPSPVRGQFGGWAYGFYLVARDPAPLARLYAEDRY